MIIPHLASRLKPVNGRAGERQAGLADTATTAAVLCAAEKLRRASLP
jgi:hypothetical protein